MGQTRLSSTGSSAGPQRTCDFAKHLSYSVGVNPQGGPGPKLRCLVGQTLVFLGAGHERFRDGRNRGMLKRYSGPLQRNLQHFIHGFYKMDREAGEYLLGDVRQERLSRLKMQFVGDRQSTRLNYTHVRISYDLLTFAQIAATGDTSVTADAVRQQ